PRVAQEDIDDRDDDDRGKDEGDDDLVDRSAHEGRLVARDEDRDIFGQHPVELRHRLPYRGRYLDRVRLRLAQDADTHPRATVRAQDALAGIGPEAHNRNV